MTGYFRRLVNTSFRCTYAGKVLFHPWGCLGRGHFIEEPAQEQRIRRFLTGYYVVLVLVGVASAATLGALGILLLLPFQMVVWPLQVRRWTKMMGCQSRVLQCQTPLRRDAHSIVAAAAMGFT